MIAESSSSTLCWHCGKSTNQGCSWSRRFRPVDGWKADLKPIKLNAKKIVESYCVYECPEFVEDEHSKKEREKEENAMKRTLNAICSGNGK